MRCIRSEYGPICILFIRKCFVMIRYCILDFRFVNLAEPRIKMLMVINMIIKAYKRFIYHFIKYSIISSAAKSYFLSFLLTSVVSPDQ